MKKRSRRSQRAEYRVQKIHLLVSAARRLCEASTNSSFERNAGANGERMLARTHWEETRASQLLSYFDTSDPRDPRCYYHHPQETETDSEKKGNREQPADLRGHRNLSTFIPTTAVKNRAGGQTAAAAAFAIRHVVSPCVSREESHPATISPPSSSSLCLAAFFSFLSSTQRLLSERIKN